MNLIRTLLSCSCQLGLGKFLDHLGEVITLELNFFIGTTHHKALPPLILLSFPVPGWHNLVLWEPQKGNSFLCIWVLKPKPQVIQWG